MNKTLTQALLALTGSALVSGCGGLFVQLDAPSVCKAEQFQVPAGPNVPGVGATTVSVSQDVTIPELPTSDNKMHSSLYLLTTEITPDTGPSDLGYVDRLDLQVPSCNIVLAQYQKGTPTAAVPQVDAPGPTDNLVPCLSGSSSHDQKLTVTLTVTGSIPTQASTVSVTQCYKADVKYNFLN